MSKKKIVISLGGSLFDETLIEKTVAEYADLFLTTRNKYQIYIVTGGGPVARKYITIGRSVGGKEYILDEIGILASKINGYLLVSALNKKLPGITLSKTIEEAGLNGQLHDIAVIGGILPGITTDGVSALLAEYTGSKILINATNVDGVYTKDPKIHHDAVIIKKMSYSNLLSMFSSTSNNAGRNMIFDDFGTRVAQRSKIKVIIINGRDIENMFSAINGKIKKGTVIS